MMKLLSIAVLATCVGVAHCLDDTEPQTALKSGASFTANENKVIELAGNCDDYHQADFLNPYFAEPMLYTLGTFPESFSTVSVDELASMNAGFVMNDNFKDCRVTEVAGSKDGLTVWAVVRQVTTAKTSKSETGEIVYHNKYHFTSDGLIDRVFVVADFGGVGEEPAMMAGMGFEDEEAEQAAAGGEEAVDAAHQHDEM
jgi:hypothetical protein